MRNNEESLDLFADLLEPVASILADKEVEAALREKKVRGVKVAIKNHKPEIIEILALLDGVPVEDYRVNLLALPGKVLELLNRPEVADLFQSLGRMNVAAISGSVTARTKDGAN